MDSFFLCDTSFSRASKITRSKEGSSVIIESYNSLVSAFPVRIFLVSLNLPHLSLDG